MATEKELEAEIIDILAKLNKKGDDLKIPETHRGKTDMLSSLKKELKAKIEADAEDDAAAKDAVKAKADVEKAKDADAKKAAKVKGYFVKPGVSVTSKKGVKVGGEEIKPEWLGGKQEALTALVKKGLVEHRA